MSTISSTNNYSYTSQLFGTDYASASRNQTQNTGRAAGNSYAKAGSSSMNSAQAQMLAQTLASLGIGSNDALSFADILGMRDEYKADIEAKVREDLRELGVGMDKKAYQALRGEAFDLAMKADLEKLEISGDYKLESDGKGGINVICADDETRAAIEEYLAKNPDRVKEFNKIQNPTRNDMVQYREEQEKSIEKSLREFLDKEGLNSKAPINLKVSNGKIVVSSSDPKVKAALEKYMKDNPEMADKFKEVEAMTKSDDVKFQLTFDKSGKPVVISNHPDKDLIQSYFDTNPDICKKFQQMDSLSTVDQARKAQNLKPSEIRKRIQMESLSTWFTSTGMGTASIMDFTGGSTALMNGLNKVI